MRARSLYLSLSASLFSSSQCHRRARALSLSLLCVSLRGPLTPVVPHSRRLSLKTLGKGHDGQCHLCIDRHANAGGGEVRVAVKMLNAKKSRRITEPDIMAQLSHKHIVRLIDSLLIESSHFLVLEFADGGDLCDYVYEHERLAEREAARILRQLGSAVGYMHAAGICHRDIKLDNIFLMKSGLVKLGDFGASCTFDQETKLTYRCGTTQYNAPELIKGSGYFGDEVDCWALGVVTYVMLVGKFPFDCDTDMQLLWQVLKGVKFPPKLVLSEAARDIVLTLCEVNSTARGTIDDVRDHAFTALGAPFDAIDFDDEMAMRRR